MRIFAARVPVKMPLLICPECYKHMPVTFQHFSTGVCLSVAYQDSRYQTDYLLMRTIYFTSGELHPGLAEALASIMRRYTLSSLHVRSHSATAGQARYFALQSALVAAHGNDTHRCFTHSGILRTALWLYFPHDPEKCFHPERKRRNGGNFLIAISRARVDAQQCGLIKSKATSQSSRGCCKLRKYVELKGECPQRKYDQMKNANFKSYFI